MGAKVDLSLEILGNKLGNTKRSLSYDFQHKVEKLNLSMVTGASQQFSSWTDIFDIEFPIKTPAEFLQFENSMEFLNEPDDEKKNEAKKKQDFLVRDIIIPMRISQY